MAPGVELLGLLPLKDEPEVSGVPLEPGLMVALPPNEAPPLPLVEPVPDPPIELVLLPPLPLVLLSLEPVVLGLVLDPLLPEGLVVDEVEPVEPAPAVPAPLLQALSDSAAATVSEAIAIWVREVFIRKLQLGLYELQRAIHGPNAL